MGNYYEIVNFDKKERFGGDGPWDFKWGIFGNGGPQMIALAYLICNGSGSRILRSIEQRWYGDRIAIVGDFSEDSEKIESFTDITPLIIKEFGESPGGRALLGLEDFKDL